MADGACDFTDEVHGRNWIITRLSPPVTIELCDEHLAPGLTPIIAAELGIEFETLYMNLDRLLKKEAVRAAKELAAAEQAEAAGEEAPDIDPNTPRCRTCGRLAGMPTAPCDDCPDVMAGEP